LLIIDIDTENDAITAQIINIALPVESIGSTSFKLSNAETITIKTPMNVPTNDSAVNINLNRILYILIPPLFYTIQHQAGRNHKTS
jgi:hypothetical protein